MKKVSRRILALLMTAIMLALCIQLNVFAADEITAAVVSLEVAVENNEGVDLSDRDDNEYEFLIYGVDTAGNAMADATFTYDIVDVMTEDFVAQNQTVTNDGTFKLQGGQRAVFNNMEAGTAYTFTEIQGATQLFIPTAKFNGENVNLSFAYSVQTGVIAESQTYDIDFTNILTPTTVTLKYYDRVMKDGEPTDISSTVKDVSYDYYGSEVEYNITDDGAYISNQEDLINGAPGRMGLTLPDNILDSYKLFASTKEAANAIKNDFVNYHTGSNYIYTEYHTNQYGHTQSNGYFDDGAEGEGEEWVKVDNDLNMITVWLFNSPKKYTVNTYGVIDENTAKALYKIDSGKYINDSITSAKKTTAFYNQRMGQKPTTESSDDTTNYLKKYNLDGYTGVTATTNETAIAEDGTTVKFLYWAFNEEGTQIASTDRDYNYRITSNTDLYAVYGIADTETASGVSLRENGYDLYADANNIGRIRLNSVLNPYGDYADSEKTAISDVAILYVDMKGVSDDAIAEEIRGIKEQLKQILVENNDAYSVSGKSVILSDNTTKKVNGFTYDVVSKDEAGKESVYLTSKNRVQFSTSFKMSQFESLRLCAVAAVCVDGEWIITDNYNDYNPSAYLG